MIRSRRLRYWLIYLVLATLWYFDAAAHRLNFWWLLLGYCALALFANWASD